ncbi:MAG: hypothetical protein ABJN26_10785 [Stappiaceae bacterium]
MLPTIVVIAEIFVAAWFLLFLTLLGSMYREALSMPRAFVDSIGRRLVGHARTAICAGITAVIVLTLAEFSGEFGMF